MLLLPLLFLLRLLMLLLFLLNLLLLVLLITTLLIATATAIASTIAITSASAVTTGGFWIVLSLSCGGTMYMDSGPCIEEQLPQGFQGRPCLKQTSFALRLPESIDDAHVLEYPPKGSNVVPFWEVY